MVGQRRSPSRMSPFEAPADARRRRGTLTVNAPHRLAPILSAPAAGAGAAEIAALAPLIGRANRFWWSGGVGCHAFAASLGGVPCLRGPHRPRKHAPGDACFRGPPGADEPAQG